MSEHDNIIERVKKMLSLANDAAASEGEVENALRLARKLMTQYGIEDAQLDSRSTDSTNVIRETSATRSGFGIWEQQAAQVVASICDTRVVHSTDRIHRKKSIGFIGFPTDVAVSLEMYPTVVISVRTLARAKYGTGWTSEHQAYALGFVQGLRYKARVWKEEAASSTAIVLRKDLAINRWVETQGLSTRTERRADSRFTESNAFATGVSDGRKIGLTKKAFK